MRTQKLRFLGRMVSRTRFPVVVVLGVLCALLIAFEATADEPTPSPTPCGSDSDGDGVCDAGEGGASPGSGETNMYLPDSDGDGLEDGAEDANRNGSHDAGETKGRDVDTDGDDYEDGVEDLLLGTNALSGDSPGSLCGDLDWDLLPDSLDPNDREVDSDHDHYLDGYEAVTVGVSAVSDAETSPALGNVIGDLDAGGETTQVDNADSQLILEFFAAHPVPGEFRAENSDVNRDGVIDNADSQTVLTYFARETLYLPTISNAVDIRIDSDNNCHITADDEDIEDNSPGKSIPLNPNQDPDRLVPATLIHDRGSTTQQWKLVFPSRVKVFEGEDRTGEKTSDTVYTGQTPAVVYLEGVTSSETPGDVTIQFYTNSGGWSSDSVKATVVDLF